MAADQATDGKAASGVGKPQVFRSPTAVLVWWVWALFAVANLVDLAVQGRDHASLVAGGILVMCTGVAYVAAQRPRLIVENDDLLVRNPLRDHRIPWLNISRVDVSDLLRVHCRLPGPASASAGASASADASTSVNASANADVEAGTGTATGIKADKREKTITAWAVHYSRRRQYTAEMKTRRDALRAAGPRGGRMGGMSQFGIPQSRSRPSSYGSSNRPEAEAMKIVRLLNDRAEAAGIEQASEDSTASPTTSTAALMTTALMSSTWSWRAIAALVAPAVILLICCLV
jgi:hypothetical protein